MSLAASRIPVSVEVLHTDVERVKAPMPIDLLLRITNVIGNDVLPSYAFFRPL